MERRKLRSLPRFGGFRIGCTRAVKHCRGDSSMKSAIYPGSRHEFEAHSPLHLLNSVLSTKLKRRVVACQAKRHAAIGRCGDVGVEREMLLHRVRVAEGAWYRARFIEAARAREAEHHVD